MSSSSGLTAGVSSSKEFYHDNHAATPTFAFRTLTSPSRTLFKCNVNGDSQKPGYKFTLPTTPVIQFGTNNDTDVKPDKGFNFVFGHASSNLDSGSSLALEPLITDKSDNAEVNELKSTEHSQSNAESSVNTENSDQQKMKNEVEDEIKQEIDDEKQKTDEISIKILFKEFKEVINEFIRERVENEKRIAALEERVQALESELKSNVENESKIKHSANVSTLTDSKVNSVFSTPPSPSSTFNFPTFSGIASTPSGTTAFPSSLNTTTTKQISSLVTQTKNCSISDFSVNHTGISPFTCNSNVFGMHNTGETNSGMMLTNTKTVPTTATGFGFNNNGHSLFGTVMKVDRGFDTGEKNNNTTFSSVGKIQNKQKLEEILNIEELKRTLEVTVEKVLKNALDQLKNTINTVDTECVKSEKQK